MFLPPPITDNGSPVIFERDGENVYEVDSS